MPSVLLNNSLIRRKRWSTASVKKYSPMCPISPKSAETVCTEGAAVVVEKANDTHLKIIEFFS